MKLFIPTYIALVGYLIMVIIFLLPPKRYNPETGEEVRKNNFSLAQMLAFFVFLILAGLSLYTINCLNLNHHVMKQKLVPTSGNIFSSDKACISRETLNEELKKAINPDSNCIYVAWIRAVMVVCIALMVFSIGYRRKFQSKSGEKTSLFDKLT